MMVLSCFTPNYPQRKGTFLDTIFIHTSPPPQKKEREREIKLFQIVTKVQRKVPLCLWISACSSKSQEAQKSNFIWPPTAIQADSENQLDPSLSARTYFSSGLRKLSQKLMDTSIPRMARAIDTIHVWEGWRDVLIHILNMKKLSFEEVESFLVFSFLEHSPCLQKCSSFQIWQVPLGQRKTPQLLSSNCSWGARRWTISLDWTSSTEFRYLGLISIDKTPIWWGATATESGIRSLSYISAQASCCRWWHTLS